MKKYTTDLSLRDVGLITIMIGDYSFLISKNLETHKGCAVYCPTFKILFDVSTMVILYLLS